MFRKPILLGVFFMVTVFPLISQSNEMIDKLLSEEKARFGLAAYLVLAAGGEIAEGASVNEAMNALAEPKFSILKDKTEEDFINFRELAYLIMQSFEMKGGILYRIFPSPRYAYKEMLFLNVLSSKRADRAPINSDDMMRLLGRVMEWRGTYQ